jgi:hypothetical protein
VFGDQHVDIGGGGAAGLLHRREDVSLLELFFVVVLAEGAEQSRGVEKRPRLDTRGIGAQLCRAFAVDKERPPEHAVLAHQVFDGADLLSLALLRPPTFFRCPQGSDIGAAE